MTASGLTSSTKTWTTAKIGIIGGSGLYQMPELTDVEEVKVDTPFGSLQMLSSSAHWKDSESRFYRVTGEGIALRRPRFLSAQTSMR